MTGELTTTEFDTRIESIAADIDRLRGEAVLQIAELIAKAHDLFLYRRDEGGFTGWVERRLSMSKSTAYKLLDVHKQFGGESFHQVETLPRSVLYLLAPDSVPESARAEVLDLAATGEKVSPRAARAIVAEHKPAPPPAPRPTHKPKPSTPPSSPAPASVPVPAPQRFNVPTTGPIIEQRVNDGERAEASRVLEIARRIRARDPRSDIVTLCNWIEKYAVPMVAVTAAEAAE